MKLAVVWLFVAALALGAQARITRRSSRNEYRMCVPENLMEECKIMVNQETKSTAKIVCIPARDRVECIDKIKNRKADFEVVDPEDMYLAARVPNQDFTIFQEIRTREEPEAEYRYEAVVVIHKDETIRNVFDLKGLKSCHTGVGRNVGYKIPITKLKQMKVIGLLNDPELSPRENELRALSETFSKACLVGDWSPDPTIDAQLKGKYSNLCQLCEHPEKCNYPDNFSGYDGALRCLAHNGGQVAWTKVIYVRKFFGLPVGVTPGKPTGENPDNYAYLCPDGTKVPVTSDVPCRWAARPWQGFMTNADVVKTIDELRSKISNLNTVGTKSNAPWLQDVLEMNNKTIPKSNKYISPGDYLDKANYTDVIERDYGPPTKSIRFCVVSSDELEKCLTFSKAAFSRDIRPRIECVQEVSKDKCMKIIQDNAADVITLDAGEAYRGMNTYNLKPIISEQYGPLGGMYYSVAVVKKGSSYKSFADLRGAKSCHTGYGRSAGYNAPLYTLIKLGLLKKHQCPYSKALAEFFVGGSCVPGANAMENDLEGDVSMKLCSLCAGNLDSVNDSVRKDTKCKGDSSESFSGYSGAFRCLAEGQGDVAFVKHVTVPGNTDGKNTDSWARNLKSEDYELLCPEGGRKPVDRYEECFLAKVPPHMVVTSNSKSDAEVTEIRNGLLSAGNLYGKNPKLFRLFGSFQGKKDLLFKDSATGLVSADRDIELDKNYGAMLSTIENCDQASN